MQAVENIKDEQWTEIIGPSNNIFTLNLKDVWRYRDLLSLLVRRDFVSYYKQTVLGPIWFFLQPLLTTITFTIIFSKIAGISTDGMPPVLFYLAGTTLWNYFSECLNRTSTVLRDNATIFGKVYFPRLVMPLSIIISNLVKLGIQITLFLIVWAYFLVTDSHVHPDFAILLLPLLIIIMGALGLGLGMIVSSLTTKYRDLVFLLTFGVQLLMYATPVIYPVSTINSKYKWLIEANPMTSIIETFRYGFTGVGSFSWAALGYSIVVTTFILLAGIIVFNKVEKSFMDTV